MTTLSTRAKVLALAALSAGAMVTAAGSATAAHCTSPDGTSPGFSYFGTVHVQSEAHDSEGRDPGHAGTPGASNCRETAGSPSAR